MSWNCYCGTLSFDVVTMYNSCKTAYQSIISTGTLSSKKFHWFCLSDKVPRQLSYGIVVPGLYKKRFIINQQGRLLQLIHWYMKTVFSFQWKFLFRNKLSCTSNMNHLNNIFYVVKIWKAHDRKFCLIWTTWTPMSTVSESGNRDLGQHWPDDTKPSPEPMLTDDQWGVLTFTC